MTDDCTPTEHLLECAMREHFAAAETLRRAKQNELAARARVEELMTLLEHEHAAARAELKRKTAKVEA